MVSQTVRGLILKTVAVFVVAYVILVLNFGWGYGSIAMGASLAFLAITTGAIFWWKH